MADTYRKRACAYGSDLLGCLDDLTFPILGANRTLVLPYLSTVFGDLALFFVFGASSQACQRPSRPSPG